MLCLFKVVRLCVDKFFVRVLTDVSVCASLCLRQCRRKITQPSAS